MSDPNTETSKPEPNYKCDDCGNAFHADVNDTPPFQCPNCKSDNASPLNG